MNVSGPGEKCVGENTAPGCLMHVISPKPIYPCISIIKNTFFMQIKINEEDYIYHGNFGDGRPFSESWKE